MKPERFIFGSVRCLWGGRWIWGLQWVHARLCSPKRLDRPAAPRRVADPDDQTTPLHSI